MSTPVVSTELNEVTERGRQAPQNYDAVLLASFGGPEGQEDVIPFLRATHGAEIAFVFGSVTAPTADDAAIATSMQGYWSRFALTGDPNGDGSGEKKEKGFALVAQMRHFAHQPRHSSAGSCWPSPRRRPSGS